LGTRVDGVDEEEVELEREKIGRDGKLGGGGTATEEESKDEGDTMIENPQRQGPTQSNQ
jgi:hypothetical protein